MYRKGGFYWKFWKFTDLFLPGGWALGSERWEWPWQPRKCSYCGGVHPDDANQLLREGWEVHHTNKAYKAYLEPPGTHNHHEAVIRDLRGKKEPKFPDYVWHASPPVKWYVPHCSAEQMAEFNKLMLGAKDESIN